MSRQVKEEGFIFGKCEGLQRQCKCEKNCGESGNQEPPSSHASFGNVLLKQNILEEGDVPSDQDPPEGGIVPLE